MLKFLISKKTRLTKVINRYLFIEIRKQSSLRKGAHFVANFWTLMLHKQIGENFVFDGVRSGNLEKTRQAIENGDNVFKMAKII